MSEPRHNPLVIPILKYLQQSDQPFSEYELIQALAAEDGLFPPLSDSQQLALFQKHFLVMNALYQLQQQLFEERLYLMISPLTISVQPVTDCAQQALSELDESACLREYYSDWRHFDNTSDSDVEALLSSFWQYYVAADKQLEAYTTLALTPDADWQTVKRRYRQLAAECHPDRGGDAGRFMAIREAYEVLVSING